MTGRPVYVAAPGGPLLGWLHEPAGGERVGTAVVLLGPFGWDDVASYRARRVWAQALAGAGHPTLRLELPAMGDSSGLPTDPDLLEAWTGAASAAAAWFRAAGAGRLAAVGIGLGGFVVAVAAAQDAAFDELVLWAVPARGRALVREIQAFASIQDGELGAARALAPLPEGAIEAGGYLLSSATAAALAATELPALKLPETAGRRALLVGRDAGSPDKRLRAWLEDARWAVEVQPGPGYADMHGSPDAVQPAREVFAAVEGWLAAGPPGRGLAVAPEPPVAELRHAGRVVRERVVDIAAPRGVLVGVLTEPLGDPAPITAVLLNAGAIRRCGPNRMWTEAARRWAGDGVATLRLDVAGVGDGDGDDVPDVNATLYQEDFVAQITLALDALVAMGLPGRFVLGGLCSGAYWAFQLALEDPRVAGAAMLNPRLLAWDAGLAEAREARRMLTQAKGPAWRRALRGEWGLVEATRLALSFARALIVRARGSGDAQSAMLERAAAGEATMVLGFSGEEPLQSELEASGVLARFAASSHGEVIALPGSDHTLRTMAAQRAGHRLLDHALATVLGQDGRQAMSRQREINDAMWANVGPELVDEYRVHPLRPAERVLIDNHREALRGRVLEIGVGGGRLTAELLKVTDDFDGIDIAPAMVEHCTSAFPTGRFHVAHLSDLSRFDDGTFTALLAGYNVLDVLDRDERSAALREWSRVLAPGGLLVYSSHNLHAAESIPPAGRVLDRSPRRVARNLLLRRRRVANHARLAAQEQRGDGWAILNDEAHEYSLLHFYTDPDREARELAQLGFELLECVDLEGRPLGDGDRAEGSPELYYVARATAA